MLIAVYICVYFCHSLLFIWFYFLLVLLLLFSLSFSFSLFFRLCLHCTVRTAFFVCVFVVFLYFMMCFWNKTDLTKICSPSHFSLSLSLWILFVDLPFYACEWVYIGVCVCFWERRSASALICFSKYFELFNINEAVKRYLFYEKTSTRSDQTTARRQTRLRIEKKYRDFLLLLLRRKHESLSLEHCCCYSLLWLKVCNFDFISIRPLNISDLFSHAN